MKRIAISVICIFAFQAGASLHWGSHVYANQASSTSQQQQLEEVQRLDNENLKFYSQGKYSEAIPFAERVLEIRERMLGAEHSDTVTSLINLAFLYYTIGDYAKAERLYARALRIREKVLGPEHPDTAISFISLAGLYSAKGDYAKAEPLFISGLEITEKVLGLEHANTAISLNGLAVLYGAKGDYAKAERLYARALRIREKVFGPEHPDTAILLINLATLYYTIGNYAKAEPLYARALEIREKVLGPEHPDTARSLGDLAGVLYARGDYVKAEPLYVRGLKIREKVLGLEHPDTAVSLNSLAVLHNAKGEYAKAESLLVRALDITEKVLGLEHLDTAKSLINLAGVLYARGDYVKTESLYVRALKIREKVLGPEHLETTVPLYSLAILYNAKGDYAKAEPLLIRVLKIKEKALGPEHPDTAIPLNSLAFLYGAKGDYAKAEPLYVRALDITEKTLGPEHPDTARSLINLAALYSTKGDYAKAEPLYARALEIREKALGPEHPDTAISLNGLAMLYNAKGDYAKAEPLLIQAIEIGKKVLGPEHPDIVPPLHNLAFLYYAKGDYVKAEPLYVRALEIREKVLGPEHPDTAISLTNLATSHYAKGDILKATTFLSRGLQSIEHDLHRNLYFGSDRQVVAYLDKFSYYKDIAISLHLNQAADYTEACALAVGAIIQFKGRSLDAITDSLSSLRRRASPEDHALFDSLKQARTSFAATILRGPGNIDMTQHRANLKILEDKIEKIEAELSRRSAEFREQITVITVEDVKKAIPPGTALVEFTLYSPFNPGMKGGEPKYGNPRYVAYVLTREGETQWLDLGEASAIDKAVAQWRATLRNPNTSDQGRGPKVTGKGDVKHLAREADRLVMQPVRKLVGNINHLFISPDGILNLIPFAALVDEKNHYLVENFQITYLTTARDLVRLNARATNREGALLVGNPDFNDESGATQKSPAESRRSGDYGSRNYGPLPGAEEEIRLVQKTLSGARSLNGKRATEAALKQVSGPRILHIATHGFFLEDQKRNTGQVELARFGELNLPNIENPMLRSGLALAGANIKRSGNEDGLLTAMEVAGLDLYGTKLVVLSACDTGVGDVKTGDGVYGLRRALVLAGSEAQMMSLWPVSDQGTRDLMIEYYKAIQSGEGRSAALRSVQLRMIASGNLRHPYYWASFILSGEWANLDGKR